MLNKLKNLLFDEEEVIDEDDLEEEIPVQKKEARPAAPVKPAVEEKRASMSRIDVTQSFETPVSARTEAAQTDSRQESVFKQPTVQRADPKPLPQEPVVQESRKTIGLTVDELSGTKPVKPAVKPAAPAAPKAPAASAKSKKQAQVYDFSPVISPIFGVDEKDVDAVQTSGKTGRPASSKTENVSSVISPMYGMDIDAQPSNIQTTVEKSNKMEELAASPATKEAEDEIPEFSLDDILKIRDESFKENTAKAAAPAEQPSLFAEEDTNNDVNDLLDTLDSLDIPVSEPAPEEIDQTTVFSNDDISFPSLKDE